MKYIKLFEEFINDLQYNELNEAIDKEKNNNKIIEINKFHDLVLKHLNNIKTEEEIDEFYNIAFQFDESIEDDYKYYDEYEGNLQDYIKYSIKFFTRIINTGIREAIRYYKKLDEKGWKDKTSQDYLTYAYTYDNAKDAFRQIFPEEMKKFTADVKKLTNK